MRQFTLFITLVLLVRVSIAQEMPMSVYTHPSDGLSFVYPDEWDGILYPGVFGVTALVAPQIDADYRPIMMGSGQEFPPRPWVMVDAIDARLIDNLLRDAPVETFDTETLSSTLSAFSVNLANRERLSDALGTTVFEASQSGEPPLETTTLSLDDGSELVYFVDERNVYSLVDGGAGLALVTVSANTEAEALDWLAQIAPTVMLNTLLINSLEVFQALGSTPVALRPIMLGTETASYDYRGALTFDYPASWSVYANRESTFFHLMTNASYDEADLSNVEEPARSTINIITRVDPVGSESFSDDAEFAQQLEQLATLSLGPYTLIDDAVVVLTTAEGNRAGFVLAAHNFEERIAAFGAALQEDGTAQIFAYAQALDAEPLQAVLTQMLTTLTMDPVALTAEIGLVEDSGADLGANGFEISGPDNRVVVAPNATVLSEPTFTSSFDIMDQSFDFYLTTDAANDIGSSWIGFYEVPFDIEPGVYELDGSAGDAEFVSFVGGERFATRADGTLTIERVEGGLSGRFDGASTDRPDGDIRVVFSDVPFPDISACVLWGTEADADFTLEIASGDPVIEPRSFSEGIWVVQSTDTYNRDFAALEDGRMVLRFYESSDRDDLFTGSRISLLDVPLDVVSRETVRVRQSGGFGERVANGDASLALTPEESASGNRLFGGELLFETVGETLTGSFELVDSRGEAERQRISGSFSGLPMPASSCRTVVPPQ